MELDYWITVMNDILITNSFLINNVIIFIVMFVFNFIGATTGGSALLTVPICISLGFTPASAIATTRVGVLGSMLAGWYGLKSKINYKIAVAGSCFAIIGTMLGAYYIKLIHPLILQRLLGLMMLLVIVFTILRKKIKVSVANTSLTKLRKFMGYLSFILVGALSGLFGGQGVLLNYILILIFRQDFLQAAATRTIINIFIALIAVIIYYEDKIINWYYAPTIIIAMMLGVFLGSIYGLKKGEKWIEKIFTIIAVLMALKLIIL